MTLLPALAAMTKQIGLVATASTTYNEPYHVARKFASLDHISGGRAGWNIVTSLVRGRGAGISAATQHLDYDTRYERAAEFVEVVKGLWDSWEDDAFLHDKGAGLFFDAAKMHVLDHTRQAFHGARAAQRRAHAARAAGPGAGRRLRAGAGDRRRHRRGGLCAPQSALEGRRPTTPT